MRSLRPCKDTVSAQDFVDILKRLGFAETDGLAALFGQRREARRPWIHQGGSLFGSFSPTAKLIRVFSHSKDFGADRSRCRSRFCCLFRSKFWSRFWRGLQRRFLLVEVPGQVPEHFADLPVR